MQRTMNGRAHALALRLSVAVAATLAGAVTAQAQNLIVSTGNYVDPGFAAGTALPNSGGVNANSSSAFCSSANCSSNVWNNDLVDANFGITGWIGVQQVNATTGAVLGQVNVTQLAAAQGLSLVTSFSSKSELALNVTPDGNGVTFMGYNSTTGQLDISNANTPGAIEPGNTDTAPATFRAVGQYNVGTGSLLMTTTNAYNGNNGRAAIATGTGNYYLVGNAGNGSGSAATTANTGVQLLYGTSANGGLGNNSQVGFYNITQQGYAADKTAKDNNFRGETVFNNTLYVTKGSGSNGIDTVYQVGSVGSLPAPGSATPITVLPGFNTQLAKTDTNGPHPFGIWFANASTLYVADKGSGALTDFGSSPTTQAGGLQKYSLVGGVWQLDYTLKGSLIGNSYTVNGSGAICGGSIRAASRRPSTDCAT